MSEVICFILECVDPDGFPCDFSGWYVDQGGTELCVKMLCLFQVHEVLFIFSQ